MNPLIEMTLVWLIVVAASIVMHYVNIKVWKKSPLHWLNFLITVCLGVFIACAYFDTWALRALGTLYLGFVHWVLFSPIVNKLRGLGWLYQGIDSDPEEDSVFDKFERKFKNPGILLGLKITLTIMLSFVLLDLKY